MIDITQLHYAWPRAGHDCVAIEKLSFAAGSSTFLHGPSGCGKSTLLGLLAGVLVPQAGHVRLLGTDWQSLPAAGRDSYRAEQAHLARLRHQHPGQ